MSLTLYYNHANPESRSVLLVCRALNINLKLEELETYKGGLKAEILENVPLDCSPVLQDGDLTIWDCHAIVTYLINQYSNNDSLYPHDPKKRVLVDEILHFDSHVLLSRVNNVFNSILIKDEREISIDKIYSLQEAYGYLDKILGNTDYVAGNELTVADLCCVASVSSATIIIPISAIKYPGLSQWFSKCKSLPYYAEANIKGLGKLDALVEEKLGSTNARKSN